jgi:hypothetical protein
VRVTSPPWSIDYHDGSGNGFHARDAGDGPSFEYVPVRPEHSSTGRYSGGDPKRGALAPATVDALWAQLHALEADVSLRTTERGKRTGAFSLRDASGSRDFIVQRGPALAAFDDLIARL